MKNSIKLLSLCIFLFIASVSQASAQNVTLAWDQNIEPEVVGYNIYYRTDTPTLPFNGTSLSEGASPIFVDGSANTALTLDLPEDGSIYYFTATAVSDTQIESSFSDTVASEWVPFLLAPPNNAVVNTAATFAWDLPPSSYTVSFDLLYGTDPNLGATITASSAPRPFNFNLPQFKLSNALPLAILLSLLMLIRSGRAKRFWRPVRVGLCIGIFALQASCGGGGGGGGGGDDTSIPRTSVPDTSVPDTSAPDTSAPDTSVPDTSAPDTSAPDTSAPDTSAPDTSVPGDAEPDLTAPLFTNVVTDIYDTEYQVTNLQPDTQYYWKIVAVDNWGNPYESLTQKFTTLSN